MKFVAIVGSNALKSNNRKLLNYMKKQYQEDQIDVVEIREFPMFNENHPDEDPELVTALAAAITASDGVIIGCPEYNHSVPSGLKSVIEWESYRQHPFKDKPVMVIGASSFPQGASRAQLHLRQILASPGVNARVFNENEFLLGSANEAFDDEEMLKDQGTIDFLKLCYDQFKSFVAMHQLYASQNTEAAE